MRFKEFLLLEMEEIDYDSPTTIRMVKIILTNFDRNRDDYETYDLSNKEQVITDLLRQYKNISRRGFLLNAIKFFRHRKVDWPELDAIEKSLTAK